MKSILAAAAVLSGLAFTTVAHATPINYTFTVTATDGPLGDTATGTFSYDSSSITPGSNNTAKGLLTSLDFTWNGIHYDQTTANTGWLDFSPSGALTSYAFGSNCRAGNCGDLGGGWFVLDSNFYYFIPLQGGGGGTTTVSLITAAPEPSTLALLGVGFAAMLMAARAKGTHRATG